MTRLAVFSDSHGNVPNLKHAIEWLSKDKLIDVYAFLGDGVRDFESLEGTMKRLNPHALIYAVRGNNDFGIDCPQTIDIRLEGIGIMLTHGHQYAVKTSDVPLAQEAKANGCRIALYGHTHLPAIKEVNGVWLMNPGAVYSALLLDITQSGQFWPEIVNL